MVQRRVDSTPAGCQRCCLCHRYPHEDAAHEGLMVAVHVAWRQRLLLSLALVTLNSTVPAWGTRVHRTRVRKQALSLRKNSSGSSCILNAWGPSHCAPRAWWSAAAASGGAMAEQGVRNSFLCLQVAPAAAPVALQGTLNPMTWLAAWLTALDRPRSARLALWWGLQGARGSGAGGAEATCRGSEGVAKGSMVEYGAGAEHDGQGT